MRRNSRRYLLVLLAVLAAGYLVYKFPKAITLEGFRWSMVVQSLRDARISLLLLAIATIYVCYAIRALRWMRFSRTLGRTHFWNVYSATVMGFACIFLLGRAAEPIRPVLIAKKDSLSIPRMFGVYVLERVFDMAAAVVLAGCALLFFERRGPVGREGDTILRVARSGGAALLAGLVVVIVFLIYFRYHGADWLSRKFHQSNWRTGWRDKIILLLEGFTEGLQGIRTWNDLGALVGYSVVHWLLILTAYLWVAHAFRGKLAALDFAGALLVLAFSMVGSAVQLPGVGGGSQLATFLVFTLLLGVEKEPAATAAIILWLVTFASCSLVGLPLLFREGWTMGALRQMARAEERAGRAALLAEAERAAKAAERPR
jgi:glycosyltransferase 2 family protein